jgi:hypothetical protein
MTDDDLIDDEPDLGDEDAGEDELLRSREDDDLALDEDF